MGQVTVVRHDGTSANYYADLVLDPGERWGIVLLLNMNSFNLYGGRLHALTGGVLSLLHGQPPPALPAMHHPILYPALIGVLLVSGLLLVWLAWIARAWRRGLPQPMTSPRGWRGYLAAGLPFVCLLGWVVALLLGIPQVLYPLAVLRINIPDFGFSVLGSGALALVLDIVWARFMLRRLRSGQPRLAKTVVADPIRM
jgi:hypothetical protein